MSSENPIGADNQQGRLEAYLSGFVDGEGSFSVGVQRRTDLAFGFQLVPEFRVSQNAERVTVLEIMQRELGCGRLLLNDRHRDTDRTHVLGFASDRIFWSRSYPSSDEIHSCPRNAIRSKPSPRSSRR